MSEFAPFSGPSAVIAVYRPKPGRRRELLEIVAGHPALLRAEGLVTERPFQVWTAADGTVLEIFEWASQAAIGDAHGNPRVMALWERFGEVCDYPPLAEVPEASVVFAGFRPIDPLAEAASEA